MEILLVNDDGIESPALLPTIEELEKLGNVVPVIPRREQSWTSKSNTRRSDGIRKEIITISGREILTFDGLPADCTNYGLFNLDKKFDLVVSGVNVGHNVGLATFFSSGTVGAALEGLFAGTPSIAISSPYNKDSHPPNQDQFYETLTGMSRIVDTFAQAKNTEFSMMTVNIPLSSTSKRIMATHVQEYNFGKLFVDSSDEVVVPNNYQNFYYPSPSELEEGSDLWAREHGITGIVMLTKLAQFVDKQKVKQWLEEYNLTSL